MKRSLPGPAPSRGRIFPRLLQIPKRQRQYRKRPRTLRKSPWSPKDGDQSVRLAAVHGCVRKLEWHIAFDLRERRRSARDKRQPWRVAVALVRPEKHRDRRARGRDKCSRCRNNLGPGIRCTGNRFRSIRRMDSNHHMASTRRTDNIQGRNHHKTGNRTR